MVSVVGRRKFWNRRQDASEFSARHAHQGPHMVTTEVLDFDTAVEVVASRARYAKRAERSEGPTLRQELATAQLHAKTRLVSLSDRVYEPPAHKRLAEMRHHGEAAERQRQIEAERLRIKRLPMVQKKTMALEMWRTMDFSAAEIAKKLQVPCEKVKRWVYPSGGRCYNTPPFKNELYPGIRRKEMPNWGAALNKEKGHAEANED